jgi:hypothetical protein
MVQRGPEWGWDVSDEQQADEPMRRPRGRHRGVPAGAAAPAGDGWRARLAAAAAPVVASVEPRIAVAAEWLFERRLHVLIVAASVATIAMIGGAVALISFTGAPQPADEASTVVETPRPTSTDPASPNSYAPILPSPGPTSTIKPTTPATPTPSPDDAVAPADEPPVEPTTEPIPEEPAGRPDPPGHSNKPDKPKP